MRPFDPRDGEAVGAGDELPRDSLEAGAEPGLPIAEEADLPGGPGIQVGEEGRDARRPRREERRGVERRIAPDVEGEPAVARDEDAGVGGGVGLGLGRNIISKYKYRISRVQA